jgi:hypothetical protein
LAHGFLSWSLGRGHQVDGDGATAAGDRVGMFDGFGCIVGEFGVFVDLCRVPHKSTYAGSAIMRFPPRAGAFWLAGRFPAGMAAGLPA